MSLVKDIRDEADLCRNETAEDIANLLDSAAGHIEKLEGALTRLCKEVGEMPKEWPSQALYKAYFEASRVIESDEFTERFMAQSSHPKGDV